MKNTTAIDAQDLILSAMKNDNEGSWRELALRLDVNPVRLSQWRKTKGMRLESLIELVNKYNKGKNRVSVTIDKNGIKVTFK